MARGSILILVIWAFILRVSMSHSRFLRAHPYGVFDDMPRIPAHPDNGAAWITGASSGIGAALAGELHSRGWSVVLSARSESSLNELAARLGDRAMAVPCDVTDKASIATAAAQIRSRFHRIGLVVSNAGVYEPFEGQNFDADLFRKTIDVNLGGAALLAEAVLPEMARNKEGHFHIVSSATGFGGMPTCSAYGASKAGLINMAECLKLEMNRFNVGISISTPGFVDTPAQADTPFPKPFMIQPSEAAINIANAVERGGFETTFPRRFTWILKAIDALPRPLYLPIVRRFTGWNKPVKPKDLA